MPPGPPNTRATGASLALASPLTTETIGTAGTADSATRRQPLRSRERLEALLRDLGPQIRQGEPATTEPLARCPSGLPEIDALLEGGFPCGRLSEIVGPPSSGRTSVALALLAHTTREAGELAAVVDPADAFDPPSAQAAGVDLERVLWVRAEQWREALRCTERLLETDGIPLVVMDLGHPIRNRPGRRKTPPIPASAWTRLARLAASTRTTLVSLGPERLAGPEAEMVLEMQPTRPGWSPPPVLLEGIASRAILVRHRGGPAGGAAELRPLGWTSGSGSA
jgi:hypothetical protein